MATYPTRPRSALLEWCKVHGSVFCGHAADIGLSTEEADRFAAITARGQAELLAQEAARQAYKVATQQVEATFYELCRAAGGAVKTIRAFAETAADPDAVYAIAHIPPVADPSPQPPPAQPIGLAVRLDPTSGSLTLRWRARNPAGTSGTTYLVRRRLPNQGDFAFIGVSGKKRFVDTTLPAGADGVQYTVQGQRADLAGPVSPIFSVHFGHREDGETTVRVTRGAVEHGRGGNGTRWNVEIPAAGERVLRG